MGQRRWGTAGLAVVAMLCAGCGSSSRRSTSATQATRVVDTEVAPTGVPRQQRTALASTPAPRRQRTPIVAPGDYRRCDVNIEARVGSTTCEFALNAFYEYYIHRQPTTVQVWSAAAQRFFTTRCVGDSTVICTASDGGEARFPLSALRGYSDQLANAYARSHDVGPTSGVKTTAPPPHGSRNPKPPGRTSSSSAMRPRICYPSATLPAVALPASNLPATTIPALDFEGVHYPAQHLVAQHIPAVHLPAQRVAGGCFDVLPQFALTNTSLLPSTDYGAVDPNYSPALTQRYWQLAGSAIDDPDPAAPGFGEENAAGFPKNEYVRSYVRQDGTVVSGYWRNSSSDGLPTCHIITC